MSDEEETYEEEAEAEEAAPEEEEAEAPAEEEPEEEIKQEEERPKPRRPQPVEDDSGEKPLTETERAMQAAKKRHEEEESAKLQEYEAQRAIQREREEEELRQLKEKQEKRKKEREEEEKMLEDRKREEDERRQREEAARLAKAEEKKKRKEAENKKKLQLMAGQFAEGAGPNFTVNKSGKSAAAQFDKTGKKQAEPGLSKEELDAQKKRVLESLVQALNLDGLDIDGLRKKVKELHARICKLEADRYDLEKRSEHQEYDFKELTERQRQQIRNKALKKGLDPDVAAASKHPPKVATASKYDRQIDRRSYTDRQYIFASDKKPKPKKVFHGSARPPSEWGRRKDNEELEQLRKNFEGHKYQEAVKVEGAKPPMVPVPVGEIPVDDEEPAAPPASESHQSAVEAEE